MSNMSELSFPSYPEFLIATDRRYFILMTFLTDQFEKVNVFFFTLPTEYQYQTLHSVSDGHFKFIL